MQVFATDIDSQAIATARAGLYPASIAADISPERLARFFTAEPDGSAYRIHKGIRDMLVFSEQDVIKDPPFSKLDLISCRNLLIYMGGELQKKLIPLFHYALNPGGFLFLGTSETVGDFGDLFATLDRKSKLYQRKDDIHSTQRLALGRFLPPMMPPSTPLSTVHRQDGRLREVPLRELTETALLQQVAPSRRPGQRPGRHPLPARPHRDVPGTGPGRGRDQQHPEDGPRRTAARLDHSPAQGRGEQRDHALPWPAGQNQRPLHHGQSDHPSRLRPPPEKRPRSLCTWSSWRKRRICPWPPRG